MSPNAPSHSSVSARANSAVLLCSTGAVPRLTSLTSVRF